MKDTIDTIYEPLEDSLLLAQQVSKYAKGKVLDMGCGSGIQGITALKNKNIYSVAFSDINVKALDYVSDRLKSEYPNNALRTNTIHSNLFEKIKDKYDTIIFNPPYLPEDEFDNEKLITTGGKKGYELIRKFLKQALNHLNINGQILLLFSSLSNKAAIDSILKKLSYSKNELTKHDMFMEKLYVYQLIINNPNIIRGHRGIVEIRGNIAIKKSLTVHYNAEMEAKFLRILNRYGIGPRYISNKKDELKMEYIKGDRILEYLKHASNKHRESLIKSVLEQLYIMDTLKINKLELTNPYKHIIVRDNNPVLIDFERCTFTSKPKNVTQFIQFLCSGHISNLIRFDSGKLRELAKIYKRNISKSNLKLIISNLKTK